MGRCDLERLREAYYKYVVDGNVTLREIRKAVEHSGGGYISDQQASELLQSLVGADGSISENAFVNGIHSYCENAHHLSFGAGVQTYASAPPSYDKQFQFAYNSPYSRHHPYTPPAGLPPHIDSVFHHASSIFRSFDIFASGRLDKNSFHQALWALGYYLDEHSASKIFHMIDRNGTGTVDEREFCEYYISTQQGLHQDIPATPVIVDPIAVPTPVPVVDPLVPVPVVQPVFTPVPTPVPIVQPVLTPAAVPAVPPAVVFVDPVPVVQPVFTPVPTPVPVVATPVVTPAVFVDPVPVVQPILTPAAVVTPVVTPVVTSIVTPAGATTVITPVITPAGVTPIIATPVVVTPIPVVPVVQPPQPTITIRSYHGKFLSAEPDGKVLANAHEAKEWEHFVIQPGFILGTISLRSFHGKFLCSEKDHTVHWNRDVAKEWESWTLIDHGATWNLRSYQGKFLCIEPSGHVVANRDNAKTWETLTVTRF